MFRAATRLGPIGLAAHIPFFAPDPDSISLSKSHSETYEAMLETESGLDRVKSVFKKDEYGNVNPEFYSIMHLSCTAAFMGACYGGFLRSRNAYLNFLERNEASIFKTPLDAKKKLQDQVTVAFGKGALQWGWRVGGFTMCYCGIVTLISIYRGKSSIYEYMVGGLVTGALYKCNIGLRGVIVGGGLGLALGTISGCCSLLLLKMSGKTLEEVRFWQYKFKESRIMAQKKMNEDASKEKSIALMDEHDRKLRESITSTSEKKELL